MDRFTIQIKSHGFSRKVNRKIKIRNNKKSESPGFVNLPVLPSNSLFLLHKISHCTHYSAIKKGEKL